MNFPSVGADDSSHAGTKSAKVVSERVWTLKELDILHELCKPTVVIASSVYESPHSQGGLRSRHKVVFENNECVKRFGQPRSYEDHDLHMQTFPEDFQKTRRSWLSGVAMSKQTTEVRIDLRILMSPLFYGISELSPVCMAKLESKPIRVETSPGHIESAILHMADLEEPRHTDQRLAAMLDRSPIHTVLFSRSGKVLCANKAAMSRIQTSHAGAGVPVSNQDNELQQICLADILDPIGGSPAVLVKTWDITNEKQTELQLEASQEALQRYNQELEEDSVAMAQERVQLQQQAESLAQRLEAVLSNKFVPRTFDADTPIDKTLAFLQDIIKGSTPSTQKALDLYHVLSESGANLRQPVELESQLLKHMTMDSEVGQSMLQLLQGFNTRRISKPDDGNRLPQAPPMTAQQKLARQQTCMPLFIPAAVTPVVERFLQDAENNWQFDVFAFAEATPGTTLSLLTFHFLKRSGAPISEGGHLDETKLCRYLQRIEAGYDSTNPYHNSVHVASVVQMTHMLLCHGGIMKSKAMTQLQHWASLWSALVHDFEHGGLNNDFLIKSRNPLAITYNDQSPLENHHIAAATRLLLDPELCYLSEEPHTHLEHRASLRLLSISQVLGTDMKKHFDILSRFQAAFKPPASAQADLSHTKTPGPPTIDWDTFNLQDKALVHQMVLKCADIGHLAAAPRTHKRWAYQLEEEFFRQGDKERACGMPLSPLMHRSTQGGMTRSQLGFFSIVGIPMFKAMAELFEDAQPMLDGVLANYHHWQAATPDAALPS